MVKKDLKTILWGKAAYNSLQEAYRNIMKDSPQNAELVKNEILRIINEELPVNPQKYPLDKFKINNHGKYRAFEKYSYRIAYYVTISEVRILRIRHVKQEPKEY